MLYSCSVSFYAQQDIIFKSYETEALHGILFKILSEVNSELAKEVHDGQNKRFTLSNFMPFTKRRGEQKLLKGGIEYKFRLTFLDDLLFQNFLTFFLKINKPVLLNKIQIHLTKILTNDLDDPWCGETTFEQLLGNTAKDKVMFKFLTPTSFRQDNRQIIIPDPTSVFGSLHNRWKLAGGLSLDYVDSSFNQIEISRYDLKTRMEQFKSYSIKGFTGECEYWFGNLPAQARQELMALARFSFYAGVGYKTTMGLGQVQITE